VRQTAKTLDEAVRAKVQEEHLRLCPVRKVSSRAREEHPSKVVPERIRISLTLECGHGLTKDFCAERRRYRGTVNVSMAKAESDATIFERTKSVACVACGPPGAGTNGSKYRVP